MNSNVKEPNLELMAQGSSRGQIVISIDYRTRSEATAAPLAVEWPNRQQSLRSWFCIFGASWPDSETTLINVIPERKLIQVGNRSSRFGYSYSAERIAFLKSS